MILLRLGYHLTYIGTNGSLPKDNVCVKGGSEQVRLNASQRSSEAQPRSLGA